MSRKQKLSRKFNEVVKGSFFNAYLSEDGLSLMVSYAENARIDVEEGQMVIDAIYPFLKQKVEFGLTDATAANLHISAAARKLYSNNKSLAQTRAHAVITSNVMVQLIANIFARFDNPVVPVKTFKSLGGAMRWFERNHYPEAAVRE